MKKALIFLLCAALAGPSLGIHVNAAEAQTEQQIQTAAEEGTEETAKKLAAEAVVILRDYYRNKNFTADEKSAADAVMESAAGSLGYTYTPADAAPKAGSFAINAQGVLDFGAEEGITDFVKNVKEQLDACKAKVPEKEDVNSNIIIGGKEYDTTIADAGKSCTIAVPLVNLGTSNVTNVVISPILSGDVTSWPFDIERTDYAHTCDVLEGENSGKAVKDRKHTFRWTLKTRDDAVTGYTKLTFQVSYNEADGTKGNVTLDYYVQVNGIAPEKAEDTGKLSTPRVIVTGFTTTPEEVYAGDTFKLTLNLKNTSKETAVSNMLFDIQGTSEGTDASNTYAAFLPTAGSSTIYVERIPANSSTSITIELKSKADLAQKPYVVTVNMEYEDSEANPFTETASVSVPIKQEAKVDLSSITLMPETIEIGNEANVMFSIYNVGKTKLYNVNVKFQADSISGGDTFLGNLDPGATGNVDAYLMGQAATMDDGTVKILITYEDEEGKEAVIEKAMNLYVSEPYYPEMYEDPMIMEGMEAESTGMAWWIYALIGLAAAGGVATAVVVVKKKKRVKAQAQEELDAAELADEEA